MKTLKLVIDLEGLNLGEEKKEPQEVVANVIKNVVLSWGNEKRGLSEEDRRIYYKISDILDKAVKEKSETVELDDQWIGFIRKVFREAKFLPNDLLRRVEDLVAEIKDR